MGNEQNVVEVMGIDAGGTMTDTFFVRADGRFVVGKAQSNPGDESLAIYNSSVDALAHWGRDVDDVPGRGLGDGGDASEGEGARGRDEERQETRIHDVRLTSTPPIDPTPPAVASGCVARSDDARGARRGAPGPPRSAPPRW
mgnify:CR=1 FL=1